MCKMNHARFQGSCTHLVKREKTKLATIGRNIEFGLALGAHRKSANNNGDGRRSIFGERTCDPCRRQSRLIDAWIHIIKCVHDPAFKRRTQALRVTGINSA